MPVETVRLRPCETAKEKGEVLPPLSAYMQELTPSDVPIAVKIAITN